MTSFNEIVPVLPVRDLAAAMSHYEGLGFAVSSYDAGYGFAARGDVHIHLAVVAGHDPAVNAGAVYLYVGDADELLQSWLQAGVGGRFVDVEETPYGLREGAHIDLDGNLIRFGSWITPEVPPAP